MSEIEVKRCRKCDQSFYAWSLTKDGLCKLCAQAERALKQTHLERFVEHE